VSRTTARKADLHQQCLPGHDPELLASMLHVLVAEGLYNLPRAATCGNEGRIGEPIVSMNASRSITPAGQSC
jgi:hypothetical protein